MRHLLLTILFTLALPLPCLAQSVLNSHEIIQNLSIASMAELTETSITSIQMPSNWEKRVTSGESVSFRVPFHPGVMGRVHLTQSVKPIDELSQEIGKKLNTSFVIEKQEPFQTDSLEGTKAVASGRLAGEAWKFLFFSGKLSNGTALTLYAQTPDYWFHVYFDFLMDILSSIKPKEIQEPTLNTAS